MKTRYWLMGMLSAGMIAGTGCGLVSSEDVGTSRTQGADSVSGLALTVDIQGDTDVTGFRYTIKTCKGKHVLTKDKSLEELTLPGNIPAFVDAPFDAQSSHLFADYFVELPEGCYDVQVQPINRKKKNSDDCDKVSADKLYVKANKTTEILLVSQCEGPDTGALDIIAALNHPPAMVKIRFEPSKFVACQETVKLCMTATDPNSDPMEVEWEQTDGPKIKPKPQVVYSNQEGNTIKECIEFVPVQGGDYGFKVSVFDMFHQEKKYSSQTKLVRAEQWFKENGYGKVESHAELSFPLYVSCEECVRDVEYWSTHHKLVRYPKDNRIPWPDTGYSYYGSETNKLCGESWLSIMTSSAKYSLWSQLAQQYIAALLNLAAGAEDNYKVNAALYTAKNLLKNNCTKIKGYSAIKAAEKALETLERYNTGQKGPGICPAEIKHGEPLRDKRY